MKKRSGFTVMARLIRLVKPLSGYMVLAILMGLVGHFCAAFITIFGGFAVLDLLGFATPVALKTTFVCVRSSRSCAASSATPSSPATTSSPSSCLR